MSKHGENITKRKDGRWEARVIKGYTCDRKARYRYIYGKSYSEAKRKKNEYLAGQQEKKQKGKDVLFSSLLSEFLIYKENNVKESTLARYREIINLHILPLLGDMQLHELTSQTIENFSNIKIKRGRTDGLGGLSLKRVRDILSVIKIALNYAQKQGYIHQNVSFSLHGNNMSHTEILSREEEIKLLSHSVGHPDPLTFGVILSLCTGIRIGELCALKWPDINTDANLITINKTLQRIPDLQSDKKTKIIIGSPKSKSSERQIPIPSVLYEQIRLLRSTAKSEGDYVLTCNSKYIEPCNYYKKYQNLLNKCGIEKHSFHILRHTFATRAVECGMDVKSLSEILGHSNVNITLARYVHPSIELKSINMEKMNLYIRRQLVSQNGKKISV